MTDTRHLLEKNIRNNIILLSAKDGITLFNNPVGTAWAGKYNPATHSVIAPRAVRYGLAIGSSDLIGITPVKITPDMVGKTIGVFTGVEVKVDKNGKYKETEEQKKFGKFIEKNGGFYILADSYGDIVNFFDDLGLTFGKTAL